MEEALWVVTPAWDPVTIFMSLVIATLVCFIFFGDGVPVGQVLVQLKLSRKDRQVLKRVVLPAERVVRVEPSREQQGLTQLFTRRKHSLTQSEDEGGGSASGSASGSHTLSKVLRNMVPADSLRPIFDTLSLKEADEADENYGVKLKPLLIFVNTKSGGKQGRALLSELRHTLEFHEAQIVELPSAGPSNALKWWAKSGLAYRILVCGGDGTVGWVLNELDNLKTEYTPPLAVLPLGTGNDLARVLGWGSGFPGGSVMPVLHQMTSAHVVLLDRWAISCKDLEPAPRPDKRGRKDLAMCNYFGIGVDAAITLDFHEMRNWVPSLFVSRVVNKVWYARSGAVNTFFRICRHISQKITLECDGELVEIPSNMEGIIVLNIPSYGGGVNLWGAQEDEVRDDDDDDAGYVSNDSDDNTEQPHPSIQDKKLEVVCVHGSFQLGAAQVGLYTAQRLRQASHVRIKTSAELPVQADGEPWRFAAGGVIELTHRGQALMLGHENASIHAGATDIVEWAAQSKVIDLTQRAQMLKEISRRVQRSKHPSRDRMI
mmetsp:Transcript_44856/g.81821  ORF Transcript_44856/g.81821 Transcript_44856/m.81821 type:complete len:544 (-) Transcript_44856:97-1728(-)